MSDQFATGVHFMIFYLSFASRPNKLHHKYFVCLVWPLIPSNTVHNISFHMLVISYHLVQRRNKNSKSKKDLHSKSKTLPNFKGYE